MNPTDKPKKSLAEFFDQHWQILCAIELIQNVTIPFQKFSK